MHCSLPIFLDEYNDILNVAEAIFSCGSYNSAGEEEKSVSKRKHFSITWRSCSNVKKHRLYITYKSFE